MDAQKVERARETAVDDIQFSADDFGVDDTLIAALVRLERADAAVTVHECGTPDSCPLLAEWVGELEAAVEAILGPEGPTMSERTAD